MNAATWVALILGGSFVAGLLLAMRIGQVNDLNARLGDPWQEQSKG